MEITERHTVTANEYDPTHTTSLRQAFARDMKRRFTELKLAIVEAIVKQDCLGLSPIKVSTFKMTTPGNKAFAYMRDPQKVEAFMRWLRQQVNKGLLTIGQYQQIGNAVEGAWTNYYILDSYRRGIIRARYEMQKAGMNVPSLDDTGGLSFIAGVPIHLDRIGLLFTRVFAELEGITAQMDTIISQILAQGMIDGIGMREMARKLIAAIDGTNLGTLGITDRLGRFIPAQRRALMLARTEVIRAFHLAAIQEYRNWGVLGVYVMAEWVTTNDDRVCTECAKMDGKKFTLDEIEPLIPAHPNCRCIAIPYFEELRPYYNK